MAALSRAYKYLAISVLFLIALGGSVRAMNAGLACPDWPLCFGDIIPDYHPQVYFEFIHRVVAGLVALATVGLSIMLFKSREAPRSAKWVAAISLFLLLTQIVFGGLTVLWQLQANVVAAHLSLGIGFFVSLIWIWFRLDFELAPRAARQLTAPRYLSGMSLFVLAVVTLQVLLGGLVASNYAAQVCSGFPKCNGEWIPTFSGAVGLHVLHRFNAYFSLACAVAFFFFIRRAKVQAMYRPAILLKSLMAVQIGVGIANVLLFTPPLITVLHLAIAAGLVAVTVRLSFLAFYLRPEENPAVDPERLSGTPLVSYSSHST